MKSERSFAGDSIPTNFPAASFTGSDDSPDSSSFLSASTSENPASIMGTDESTRSLTRT